MLWLAACNVVPIAQAPPTVVLEIPPASGDAPTVAPATRKPAPTPTVVPTVTGTATLASTPSSPPPTPPPCRETAGRLIEVVVPGSVADSPMRTRVYLPPCYEARPDLAYPVLYLLHGRGHTQATWDEIGADEAADSLISADEAPPFIIVMPREVGGERFGEAVVADLLPAVAANFRTIARRSFRALGGMSRGGGWALRIGLQHPQLFSALGLHSLAIFYEDEASVNGWIDAVPGELLPRLYIDIGALDGLIVSAEFLHENLTIRDIPHKYIVQPGGHSTGYWGEHVEEYLRWYAEGWAGAPLRITDVAVSTQE